MIEIDGAHGEGGGQIVRSSLALSLVTEQSCTIHNIRARRKRPGLMRQHLTAVQAAARISGAHVEGAEVGSLHLVFQPEHTLPGDYEFDVGSAGSTTLVLQAVLPALLLADGPSRLTLSGGTHNPFAPPYDFLANAFLPLVNRMGPHIHSRLVRPGFYPAGGGEWTVQVQPSGGLGGLELLERGRLADRRVRAIVSRLPDDIGRRECDTIARATNWDSEFFEVQTVSESRGPGNVVMIELEFENVTEVFTGFGKRGVPAERVARQALKEAQTYESANVPVGIHLADQLMLPLGISAQLGTGGGAFRTLALSKHSTTHIEILRRFLPGLVIDIQRQGDDDWLVRCS